MFIRLSIGIAAFVLSLSHALAAELSIAATVAAKSALQDLAPVFEKATGHTLKLRFASAAEIRAEIERGAPFDVAVLTAAAVEELVKAGKADGATNVAVFRSGIGIATTQQSSLQVTTPDQLRQALTDARMVVMSTQGASGAIMRSIFDRFGMAESVKAKLLLVTGETAPQALASGRGDLAFTQISEILDTPAARFVGPLPAGLQVYSNFSACVASASASADAAKAFVVYMKGAAARPVWTARGLDPV